MDSLDQRAATGDVTRRAPRHEAGRQVDAPVVAHEMRTPLAVAVSAAETMRALLRRPQVDRDELDRLALVIERNGRLAAQLLERLNVARDIDRGTVVLDRHTTDVCGLVRDSVTDVSAFVLRDHSITIVAIGPIEALVDDTAVREIILNLLTNAAKYSEPGADIAVRVEQVDDLVRVVVRNHGSGVTPGDSERIFDQYVQMDASSPGLGLGLFVARGLARAHGGELSVRPAATSGSEFVLELPLAGEQSGRTGAGAAV